MALLPVRTELGRLCVVLVGTRNPLNIGAAARAMSNFGILDLRVVNPYEVAFRRARSAVGAAEVLKNAREYESVAEAVGDCGLVVGTTAVRHRDLKHDVERLEVGARRIRKHLASGSVALLFGTEKTGLSNHDLSHCHSLIRIPTREEHISMNLGQAVAVCLYELIRQSKPPATPKARKTAAAAGETERVNTMLLDALRTSGYLTTLSEREAEKIRRLVIRMNLSREDANVWLGILRQILWKIGATK